MWISSIFPQILSAEEMVITHEGHKLYLKDASLRKNLLTVWQQFISGAKNKVLHTVLLFYIKDSLVQQRD